MNMKPTQKDIEKKARKIRAYKELTLREVLAGGNYVIQDYAPGKKEVMCCETGKTFRPQ